MRTEKPKGLYLLGESAFDRIYGADTRRDIEAQVEIVAPLQTPESIAADPAALADVSLIFSGWGMARVDEAFLAAAPNLEAIFYAAGCRRGPQTRRRFVSLIFSGWGMARVDEAFLAAAPNLVAIFYAPARSDTL